MEQFAFAFTVFFMLLGPIKLIPAFAGVTRNADAAFKRSVAIRAAAIASVLCGVVALVGVTFLSKYRISVNAVRIGGGLVLLIAALQVTFRKAQSLRPSAGTPRAIQIAASPVAVPNIVPPAGIAAILLFMMHAPQYAGMAAAVLTCLAIVMMMDFLVMYFIDGVMKTPGLSVVLPVFGSALAFVQVCLAIQIMLVALEDVRLIPG
jgi:multiple antibiotic resistance protein